MISFISEGFHVIMGQKLQTSPKILHELSCHFRSHDEVFQKIKKRNLTTRSFSKVQIEMLSGFQYSEHRLLFVYLTSSEGFLGMM